jgi:hypothetical protein
MSGIRRAGPANTNANTNVKTTAHHTTPQKT